MAAAVSLTGASTTGSNASHLGVSVVEVTGDASYPAGGYVLSNAQLGVPATAKVLGTVAIQRAAGFTPVWDTTTGALRLFFTGAGLSAVLAELGTAASAAASITRLLTFWEGQ